MRLTFIIITLSVIKGFYINLISVKRASTQLSARINRVLMVLKVGLSVGTEIAVNIKAFLFIFMQFL